MLSLDQTVNVRMFSELQYVLEGMRKEVII